MSYMDKCPKCNNTLFRFEGNNFCPYCGERLKPYEEKTEIQCPMCHGTGKIHQAGYHGIMNQPYFSDVKVNGDSNAGNNTNNN